MILGGDDVRAEPVGQLTVTQPLPIAVSGTQVGIHDLGHPHALQQAQGQRQFINEISLILSSFRLDMICTRLGYP
jgi:hypothetical protein